MSDVLSAQPDSAPVRDNRREAIISPFIDFIMVGGITLLLFPLSFMKGWHAIPGQSLYVVTFYIAFIINYPHFMNSYQLLYENFRWKLLDPAATRGRKIRLWVAGVISPLFLILFLIFGALQESMTLISYGVVLMFFFVGWHYVKQGYGIMMVLAARKKIFFGPWSKRILLFNTYAIWIYLWLAMNWKLTLYAQGPTAMKLEYVGITYYATNIPYIAVQIGLAVAAITTLASLVVLARTFWVNMRFPFNGAVAYLSPMYLWLSANALFFNPNYYAVVPILHSLQYLPFVWKISYEKAKEEAQARVKGATDITLKQYVFKKVGIFVLIGIITGALFFQLIPAGLDKNIAFQEHVFGAQLFLYCFFIFINIHHYFIDFAIWRKDNPEMKYLFK